MNNITLYTGILITIMLAFCSKNDKEIAEISKINNLPKVTCIQPIKQDFEHKIEILSNVQTDNDVLVINEEQGVIREILVHEGQRVKKGQLLAIIDSEILQSNEREIQKSLELAEYLFQKQKSLYEKGIGSEVDFESAKNNKEKLERSLSTLQTRISKTVIKAPISGFVEEIYLNIGEMSSFQAPFARLVDTRDVHVVARISETHFGNVHSGSEVEVSVSSHPDTALKSKISSVGHYIDPVNRTFMVRANLSNNMVLLPNMMVIMKIVDFQKPSALTIKRRVIQQAPDGGHFIYVLENDKNQSYSVRKVDVEILSTYENTSAIEILSGSKMVDESTLVVDEGAKRIANNDKVSLID